MQHFLKCFSIFFAILILMSSLSCTVAPKREGTPLYFDDGIVVHQG